MVKERREVALRWHLDVLKTMELQDGEMKGMVESLQLGAKKHAPLLLTQ